MGLYLLKRILLAIPALLALATVIFLLSRLLPGNFGSERILQGSNVGFYGKSTKDDRRKAYEEYVHRTGQHLPLFYFSITAGTQQQAAIINNTAPADKERLNALMWQYGDARLAAAFMKHVTEVQKSIPKSPAPEAQKAIQTLTSITSPDALTEAALTLQSKLQHPPSQLAIRNVLSSLELLQHQQNSFAFLIPTFNWHGTQNQYHQWLIGVVHGDLGYSYRTNLPVLESLLDAVANTWWLLMASMLLTLLIALEMSILMVRKSGRWLRKILMPILFITDSIPSFVLALLLLVLLANPDFLQLFPVYGMGYYTASDISVAQQITQWLYYMALPMLCLILFNLPYLTNQFYTAIHAAMQADYTRTAKAKGLGEGAVIRKHALRNSLLPIITIISDFLPALVTGTFIVETIFAIPGIGRMLIESVLARDYPVLTGIVLLIAAFRIAAFILADIAYACADPRVKQQTL